MRAAFFVALAVFVPTAGASLQASTSSTTSLRVTYWEDSARLSSSVTWTLRCKPARGSLPRPARACRKLAAGGAKLLAPLPENIVCTLIYGGPQRARVVGVLAGKHISANFARTNGCEIGRWKGLSPWLLPPGGVT